jgi:hypothetical protein
MEGVLIVARAEQLSGLSVWLEPSHSPGVRVIGNIRRLTRAIPGFKKRRMWGYASGIGRATQGVFFDSFEVSMLPRRRLQETPTVRYMVATSRCRCEQTDGVNAAHCDPLGQSFTREETRSANAQAIVMVDQYIALNLPAEDRKISSGLEIITLSPLALS